MSAEWSAERVLALAPDPASAKAGQGLASAKKWANLGRGEGLIWGECQGSGKDPYRTQVDPGEPAFSCSCPSRKFPCKHALGLMLAWASGPGAFAEGTLPARVASWKEARARKVEVTKEKAGRDPAPVDTAARAKRQAARAAKVASGMDDLSLWLSDIVRQGFTSLGAKSRSFWDDQARRMIDAQAPGVARRLRQIDQMTLAGEGWQASLLDRLARLHLLAEGFRRREALAPAVADDVRSAIGFPADLDAVRSGPGVRDHWQVIGQAFAVEEKIIVRRTWLLGRDGGRPALLIDFAAGGKPMEAGLPPGSLVDAELAFLPGSFPLRALLKDRHATPGSMGGIAGGTTIEAAFAAHGAALAKDPWLELYPIVLRDVVLREEGGSWSARDATGAVVPLSGRFRGGWHLLAMGGGGPLALSGEFDGESLEVLACHVDGRFVPLVTPETGPQGRAAVSTPGAMPLLVEATASAVVGVDRKPPPTLAPDDPIAGALAGVEAREAPSRLLAIAAAAGLYGRVGRKPSIDSSSAPDPGPPESQAGCGIDAARRLRAILGGEQADLLPEWLELLAASGKRLPHDAIVEVLDRQPPPNLPAGLLVRALGVRGRWLASKNPAWRGFAGLEEDADPVAVWETGTRHERLAALRALRGRDPGRARDLATSTFGREPADDRAAHLGEFALGLSMDDEPFLESALDDRGKEVRRRAAELLRSLPGSRLCLRMIERARPLLAWEKVPSGLGRGSLIVEPPAGCDQAMIRDGVEPKPPAHLALGERAWWLREIISAVPTRSVSESLGVDAAEVVAANRGGEWEAVLWAAWASSSIRHRDDGWAEALLEASPTLPYPRKDPGLDFLLLAALASDRRDAHLVRRLRSDPGPLRPGHPALGLVRSLKGPVGVEAAREILNHVRPILAEERAEFADPGRREALREWSGHAIDPNYHDHQTAGMIADLGGVLPLDLADEAAADRIDDGPPRLYYASAYARTIDQLTFRRDMHREFAP